jgi:hypothetical protein
LVSTLLLLSAVVSASMLSESPSDDVASAQLALLFVVARHRRHLCASLLRDFGGLPGFRIVIDRRRSERRGRLSAPVHRDRRLAARRRRGIDHELVTVGFAIIALHDSRGLQC